MVAASDLGVGLCHISVIPCLTDIAHQLAFVLYAKSDSDYNDERQTEPIS